MVSGPVVLPTPPGVERVSVETALEMRAAVMARVAACDLFAAAAAVADYRPQEVHFEKLKKQREQLQLRLVRNPDILAEVAALRQPPFTLGFAAETQDMERHARKKLEEKHIDIIAANLIGPADSGFASDTNRMTLFFADGRKEALEVMDKEALAHLILDRVAEQVK